MTATVPPRSPLVSFDEWPAYRIALWGFLVNEGLLFGTLLAAGLFLRFGGTVPWPRPGDALPLGPAAAATLILIGSSATLNEALDALRRDNRRFTRSWLLWTFFAGAAFLGLQTYEWWDLIEAALAASPVPGVPFVSNPWGAATTLQVFFLSTGLHWLHVAFGLVLMAWLLAGGTEGDLKRLESVALYWHFVDFVWIFIFTTLYLI